MLFKMPIADIRACRWVRPRWRTCSGRAASSRLPLEKYWRRRSLAFSGINETDCRVDRLLKRWFEEILTANQELITVYVAKAQATGSGAPPGLALILTSPTADHHD